MKLFKRNERAERPLVCVEVHKDGSWHTKLNEFGYDVALYAVGAIASICAALEKSTGGRITKEETLERAQRILRGEDAGISVSDPVEADRAGKAGGE